MRLKTSISTAVLCLGASVAQAVVNDTVVISTDVGNNDELYKLNPNNLSIQAQHALGYFDNIGSLAPLPNGNFALIPVRGNGSSRAFLMHTDLFNGNNSTEAGNTGSISNGNGGGFPSGGSIGGMTNRFGEIFLSGRYSNFSGGARIDGTTDDAMPTVSEANGGYWDNWQAGGALSNGNWVIAGNSGNAGPYDSIEVTNRAIPGGRVGYTNGFDHGVTAINVNSLDHIGLAYPNGGNVRVSAYHVDLSIGFVNSNQVNMTGTGNFVISGKQYVDITSLANGDFVVAANDTGTGEGFLYRLREDTDSNTLVQIDLQGGFGLITKLGVQSDDDVLIGARTTIGGSSNSLFRYNFATDSILSQMDGFAPINNIIALPGVIQQPGWVVDDSGDWNISTNWSDNNVPNGVGSLAILGSIITGTQTVFTNTAITVGTLKFDNTNTYTVDGGGSLTIQTSSGSGSISVLQGSHKINVPLTFASDTSISIAGGATLTIGNPITINAGKTVTKSGNLLMQAPLTIGAGGGLILASGPTQLFGAPSLGAGAKIDVKNTSVSVNYAGLGSPASTINSQLASGFASGAWNGAGINTSSAITGETGLGWKDNPASETITVKYTYYGDANLDGAVSSLDFTALATHFNGSGVWEGGDFNYDGKINALDFNALATNFGKTPIPAAALGALVPEPTSMSMVALLALAGLTRRRHRLRVAGDQEVDGG